MGSEPSKKGCLLVTLLLAVLLPCQSQLRRGSPRSLARSPSRQSFIQRSGRDKSPQYGGEQDQDQYGEGDGGCEESDDGGGGVDFAGCEEDPDTGFCCVEKMECVASVKKDPILECTHRNVEQCHYTYITTFIPNQEEVCEDNYEKSCSITFSKQAYNETIQKCYVPVEKVCNGQGEEQCTTVYESSCTTKYVEKRPGKFVGDTACEKLPTELCGAGCTFEEGPEECHDKILVSIVEIPEEVCDLNPQKTCRYQTKLVPRLMPKHECTIIPKETCLLKFTTPRQTKKKLLTKWCLDPQDPEPGESYDESNARGPVLSSGSAPQKYGVPAPSTNNYDSPPTGGFDTPVFPPSGEYDGASPSTDYAAYPDYDYGAPSGQTSDTYSVPGSGGYDAPANGGYNAPSSAAGGYSAPAGGGYGAPTEAAGGYSGPADDTYTPPGEGRRGKTKSNRRSKTVLPKRTFRG